MNKNFIIDNIFSKAAIVLLSVTAMAFTACSDDDDPVATGYDWNVSNGEIVHIKPERYKLQRNPMQGWNIYAGLGDGMIDNFWDVYDNFDSSDGKVKVSDYGTTLFIRGAWSDFNPERGVYVWQDGCNTKPAQRFKMLVNGAKERNLRLAFSFIVDSRDKHYNFTPQYVKDDGAQGFWSTTGSVQVWSPYPDDPVFQQDYTKFIEDFAAQYNDPDLVNYISGTGLGKWGETHSLIYSTGDETPRQAVFDYVTDLYTRVFTKVPVVINYHRCLLSTGSFSNTNLDFSAQLIDEAVNKGYSLRHDAFGMKSYYTTWERGIATKYRYKVPIIMEGGWVESQHSGSIKGDGYANFAEVRQGEFDEGKGAYVNMMDLRYSNDPSTGETHSWFNTAFDLVKQFISEGGYRLYPDQVAVPTQASSGQTVTITHRWSNLGWGYCPTNIPQWNQKYKVCFALLDKSTEKPVFKAVDTEPCLNDWIKGTPKTYSSQIKLDGVSAGEYIWAVGLVDTTEDNNIGLEISARDEYKTSDGWVKLANVSIK